MKAIKMFTFLFLGAAVLSLCIIPATAKAYDVSIATITRLGMYPGSVGTTDGFMLQIQDTSGGAWTGSRTFYLSDTLGKSAWATVLTGYSLGKTLWLRVVSTEPGSLITIVHIND